MHRERQRDTILHYSCGVKQKEDKASYEAWATIISPLILWLECPDINLTKPIIAKLGLGDIIKGDLTTYGLDNPDSCSTVESAQILTVHAFNFRGCFTRLDLELYGLLL